MPHREPCEHGRYDEHRATAAIGLGRLCPGGRTLTDVEALRTLLFDEPTDDKVRPDILAMLRPAVEAHRRVFALGGLDYLSPHSPIWHVAEAVLAALDPEGDTP